MARVGDRIFALLLGLAAAGTVALLLFIAWSLAHEAWPAIQAFGLRFLTASDWSSDTGRFGALPYLYGTVVSSLLGVALALPIAVGCAVALVFLLPRWLAGPIGLLVELLAAVPSIVFGVWGFYVILPFVRDLSGGTSFGYSILAAGLVLACMVLPIITTVTREMLKAVPRDQADAALALGATPWEVTWKVVLPHAKAGILAGTLLGLGRATGETMAVILVVGNQPIFPKSLFDPGATMAATIANEFGEATDLHRASLVYLGLLLLAISLVLNLLAKFVVRRLGVRRA